MVRSGRKTNNALNDNRAINNNSSNEKIKQHAEIISNTNDAFINARFFVADTINSVKYYG